MPYGTAEEPAIIAARQSLFSEGFLVVEQDDRIVGYGSSEKWLQDPDPVTGEPPQAAHDPDGTILCITAIAIRNSYRGRGFGTDILDGLIDVAKRHNCRKIKLETSHAADFYLHRGFQIAKHKEQCGLSLTVLEMELSGGTSE